MDLSVIIVNWKSKEYLRKCITSILAGTQGIEFEIVVIDNASFDGCDEMLRGCHPQVRFIQSERNLGFSKANNAAFQTTCGRYVLFLNPDTELVASAVNIILKHLQELPNAGAVGCKVLNGDKTVQTSCVQSFPTILNKLLNSELLRALWPKSSLWGNASLFDGNSGPVEVEAITGACVMLKRSVFQQVDMFSEDYFMYTEDIDLSYKVRQAGYRNYYVPDAQIIHFGGGSSKNAPTNFSTVMMQESICRYFQKTRGNFYVSCYRALMLLSALFRIATLAIMFPIACASNQRSSWSCSFKKWRTIFCWCLNMEMIKANVNS
jgi:GT2 family glycosyltransferase